jgi:hypothetical protein
VGDEDDGDPALVEPAEHREEMVGLAGGQRRRRLVEHQHRRLRRERAADHHELALGRAQPGHGGRGIEPDAEGLEQLGGAAVQLGEAHDRATAQAGVPDEHVLGDAEVLQGLDLLGHEGDAVPARVGRGPERDPPPVQQHVAVVASVRVDAVEDLHQRRLAGAVVAEQRVDLAAADREVDAAQRLEAGKGLREPARFEDVAHRGFRLAR